MQHRHRLPKELCQDRWQEGKSGQGCSLSPTRCNDFLEHRGIITMGKETGGMVECRVKNIRFADYIAIITTNEDEENE